MGIQIIDNTGAVKETINVSQIGGVSLALGQTTMASSLPVAIASNQTAIPVSQSGTWTVSLSGGSTNAAASATGSAVPSSADYGGINVGGMLRGWTGVNPSGTVYAAQTDLSSVGGTTVSLGSATSAHSIPVVLASDQAAIPVTPGGGIFNVDCLGSYSTGGQPTYSTTGTYQFAMTSRAAMIVATGVDAFTVGTNADFTAATTTAPNKVLLAGGKSNDATAQYQPLPLGTGGRSIIVEGVSGGTAVPVSIAATVTVSVSNTPSVAQSGTWTMAQGSPAATGNAWPHKITDGTNTAVVTASSTAATAGNAALVVALSPNSPLPAGANVVGGVTQSGTWTVAQGTAATLSGAWPVKVTDGTNTMPTMDAAARKGFHAITDGTNTAAVKAASTAAAAADPSLVVGLSPNSPLPAGTNTIGGVNKTQQGGVALTAAAAIADGATNPTAGPDDCKNSRFNGTTWDRERGNVDGTGLASAARTTSTSTANITNYNGRGVCIFLRVTAASGTGGLQVVVYGVDPVTGVAFQLHAVPTAITGTGAWYFELGPGATQAAGGAAQARWACQLPRTFLITVVHGDSSSYTYSLGYSIIQ